MHIQGYLPLTLSNKKRLYLLTALCLVAVTFFSAGIFITPTAATLQGTTNSEKKALKQLGQLPLSFEINNGQFDKQVQYFARGLGYEMFLINNEMVLNLQHNKSFTRSLSSAKQLATPVREANDIFSQTVEQTSDVLRIQLIGAQPNPQVQALETQPGKINYYQGNNPKNWKVGVPTYSRVSYTNIYPHINLVYYGKQHELEYDFVVTPGGDPQQIRMAFVGTTGVLLDNYGNLLLQMPDGRVEHKRPVIYQENKGQRKIVQGNYVLLNRHTVGFQVGDYDKSVPLVIDPVLVYASYLGGTLNDYILGIVSDNSGIYVAGSTVSPTFPGTASNSTSSGGLYQTTNAGNTWSNKTTGLPSDQIIALAVDPSNAQIIYAATIARPYKSVNGGATWVELSNAPASITNLIIAPTNPSNLIGIIGNAGIYRSNDSGASWSFLSYSAATNSGAFSVTFDPTNSSIIFVATAAGVVKSTNGGSTWALSNTGLTNTVISSIAIDPTNSQIVYAATSGGVFKSTNGGANWSITGSGPINGRLVIDPLSPNTIYNASSNTFLRKTTDGGLTWSYLSTATGPTQIVLDPISPTTLYVGTFADGVYKSTNGGATFAPVNTGISTRSTVRALALSPAASSTVYAGFERNTDIFITKLSPAGDALLYSTYIGGTSYDIGTQFVSDDDCLAIDTTGNAYIVSQSWSADFPTLNAFQNIKSSGDDITLTKLSTTGTLAYSTFLGGNSNDRAYGGVAVDNTGNVYVAGYSSSSNFPILNGFQTTNPSSNSGVIAKFNPNLTGTASLLYSTYLRGADGFTFIYGVDADNLGNVYVGGETTSTTFPTMYALQSNAGGGRDGFLTKINTILTGNPSLLYSTYLGGSANETVYGVAVDATGKAYVTGSTSSPNFPLVNAFQSVFNNGDAFISTINPSLTGEASLLYSTYFGGASNDTARAIAVNSTGEVYITGIGSGLGFPLRNNFNLNTNSGAYLAKFNPALVGSASLIYSTFLGSGTGSSIFADSSGNVFIGGFTSSIDFPILNPFQTTIPVYSVPGVNTFFSDGFIAKVTDDALYTVSPLYQFLPGGGGSASVNVTASGSPTAWAVTNLPSWLTATPTSGAGSATITFTATANPNNSTRTANLLLAGHIVTIRQSNTGCNTFTINSSSANVAAVGATGSINVTANTGCLWSTVADSSWIQITSANTSGNGAVNFSITANAGPARNGKIYIGTQTFVINQESLIANDDHDNDGIPNAIEYAEGRNPFVKDNDIYSNNTTSYRLFVMQQYRDFLGREGDAPGIQAWVDLLANNTLTRAQVIQSFFNSPEFQQYGAPIVRLYFAYFNRIPDYGGQIFWTNQLRGGMTLEAISQVFATSPEFIQTYGNLNNPQFVTLVYQNVLNRTPTQPEIDSWVALLNQGASRGQVMTGFSESPEFKLQSANKVFVVMMYVGMLRRAPEQAGFDGWVALLNGGTSQLVLTQAFLDAPEYRNRFLP